MDQPEVPLFQHTVNLGASTPFVGWGSPFVFVKKYLSVTLARPLVLSSLNLWRRWLSCALDAGQQH